MAAKPACGAARPFWVPRGRADWNLSEPVCAERAASAHTLGAPRFWAPHSFRAGPLWERVELGPSSFHTRRPGGPAEQGGESESKQQIQHYVCKYCELLFMIYTFAFSKLRVTRIYSGSTFR